MKKSLKKLALSKETLRNLKARDLDAQQLAQAAAGISATCYVISNCGCTGSRFC